MSIPKNFIDQIIDQTNIVDVVGRRLQLTKKGDNYWCLCPFHDDKNPSMAVNETKQFYYCFVCQESGNAVNFLRKYENLDFVDAIETLASSLGLEVPYEKSSNTNFDNDVSYEMLKLAKDHYLKSFLSAKSAQAYIEGRGISSKTREVFDIGYVPDVWDFILEKFKNKFSSKDLDDSGLFIKKENKMYDRFRGRIIFPIQDIKGRYVGFGGRIIDKGEPKYLNSPETKFFNKSNELFGLYQAKQAQATESLIVVEGYMDVISLHQFGFHNAVATLGTAVTRSHVTKLLRYTKKIFFAFDGDQAGLKAAWKALINIFPILREDIDVRFIFFEQDKDPDTYLKEHGADGFKRLLTESITISDYFFSKVKDFNLEKVEGRAQALSFAMPCIQSINHVIIKNVYLSEVAKLCGVSVDELDKSSQEPHSNKPEIKADAAKKDIKVKAMINIFQAIILFPRLASHESLQLLQQKENFKFLEEIISAYKNNADIRPASIVEIISNDSIKSLFSQATVNDLNVSEENAIKLIEDCVDVLLKNQKDREQMLKDKYNSQSISASERRELQKLILMKDQLDTDDKALLTELSSKKN